MCFSGGGGGAATQPLTRRGGSWTDTPLTDTEKEQRRSESAAWESKGRSGANPFISMPQSRIKAMQEDGMKIRRKGSSYGR
jgi:hypothetical protein